MKIYIDADLYDGNVKDRSVSIELERQPPHMLNVDGRVYYLEAHSRDRARYQLRESQGVRCLFCGQKEIEAGEVCPKNGAHDFDDVPF